MEMVFLIFQMNNAAVIMPDKYSKAQCEMIAKEYTGYARKVYCVPVSKNQIRYCANGIDFPCIRLD